MSYRQDPPRPPLLTIIGNAIVALDATTGRPQWSRPIDRQALRVLTVGGTLFVATYGPEHMAPSDVLLFDIATGAPRGQLQLGFKVRAALAAEGVAYFAGEAGLVALGPSGLLFRVVLQVTSQSSWSGDKADYVCLDASGKELWRTHAPDFKLAPFLALGSELAQSDLDA